MHKFSHLFKKLALFLLSAFMMFIRPLLGPKGVCRFRPTCSQYAREAITKYGAFKGGWLALKRLLKCHPWHPGGYDPVP